MRTSRLLRNGRLPGGAVRVAAIMLALCACGGGSGREQCAALPTVPCPIPHAMHLTVSSAMGGGAVAGVSVSFTGAFQGTGSCAAGDVTTCDILGPAGRYDITVSAPGFQSVERLVDVPPLASQGCGCTMAVTQDLTIALTAQS